MFHSRTMNYSINKLQERAVRLAYNDSSSFFSKLLQKDNSFPIHHQNIQKSPVKTYKVKHHKVRK